MRLSVPLILATIVLAACVACTKGPSTAPPAAPSAPANDATRAYLDNPAYKKHVQDKLALMQKEEQVVEQADWFGKTGLPDATERELPRYIRREFGQSIFDQNALQANSLQYLGVFADGLSARHFWRIVDRAKEDHFAYVTVSAGGETVMGWGGRPPLPK